MKKLLVLASGVASVCALNVAHAQSSVTLYGVIDNGLEYQDPGAAHAVVRETSGGLFASRYGLKGSEDIGGGLHVNFQLEQGFSGATGTSTAGEAFSRQAWVGLSGNFGEMRIGLQNTSQYIFLNPELDPMAVMSMGSPMNNFNSLTVRANNVLSYFTPTLYGVTAHFMVGMRDSTTTPSNGFDFYNAVVRYVNGPFHAAAGYEQDANAAGTSILKIFNAGTSLGVGDARFYLAYHTERQTEAADNDNREVYEVSSSYLATPIDQFALMYGFAYDRSGLGNNAQQIGLTYEHFLSKVTTLYISTAFIQNRNQAQFTLNGTAYAGVAVAPGADTRGVIVGFVHMF